MKLIKLFILAFAIASMIGLVSCNKETNEQKSGTPQTNTPSAGNNAKVYLLSSVDKANGKIAADFSWMQDGKQIKFSEFAKDKYVLLNFWGTWCPPCRRELPDLVAIAKELENKNFAVLGIALERSEVPSEAQAGVAEFWTKNSLYYPVIIGNGEIAESYGGISAVPTTFLINNKGEIVTMIEGSRSKEEFLAEINKMMK